MRRLVRVALFLWIARWAAQQVAAYLWRHPPGRHPNG
jgi:hypothetical protein